MPVKSQSEADNFNYQSRDFVISRDLRIHVLSDTETGPCKYWMYWYIDGLVQDCSNTIGNALHLLQSCDITGSIDKYRIYECGQLSAYSLIARFMGPTWGPSGTDRTQVGPMLAPWTLLSGLAAANGTKWQANKALKIWRLTPLQQFKLVWISLVIGDKHRRNKSRRRQSGQHLTCDIFKYISLNENVIISIRIWMNYVVQGSINNINNIPALVQIIAWCRPTR